MLAPSLILWEPGERFAGQLRRQMRTNGAPVPIRETRSTAECLAALRKLRASAVVVRLGEEPLPGLELIERARRLDSSALVIAVSTRRGGWLEPIARELGASHFDADPVAVESLAELLVRHFRRCLETPGDLENGQD